MVATRKSRILDGSGNRFELPVQRKSLKGSYDVLHRWGQSDHWNYATSQNSAVMDSQESMQRLRDAARHTFRNDSHCRSVVLKQAHEVLGTGPSLQIEPLKPTQTSTKAAKRLERFWHEEYCREVDFNGRLRTGLIERPVGGEVFSVFRANRGLSTVPVDFENYEADQFRTPYHRDRHLNREYPPVDGMKFDQWGNVEVYHRLKYHPNGLLPFSSDIGEVDEVSPSKCVHLFRKERPSQYRGVTELAPCLELFAKLRRYTDATIETAERQARIVGTIQTNAPPETCADVWDEPMAMDVGGGTFMNLPDGWGANAFSATQPVTAYGEFKREILHEIFSAFLTPWNVASGDSSSYNFASGRLDYIIFYHVIDIIRKELEEKLLNRFFEFWLEYAALIPGVIPTGLGAFRYEWYWDEREPIDVAKQAAADEKYHNMNMLNIPSFYQRQGMSWRDGIDRKLEVEQYEAEQRKQRGMEASEPKQNPDKESNARPEADAAENNEVPENTEVEAA